jgi:Uma2 family endonuclease
VVIEIESPGDETREKLAFYALLSVPEVWILDRDRKTPEVLVLGRDGYGQKPAGADGWIRSDATGLELRPGEKGKLAIRLAGDEATRENLPSRSLFR